jgi:hypothetical protein
VSSLVLVRRDDVTVGLGKVHTEELHSMYVSPRIMRIIKLRKMKWAGNIRRIRKREMHIDYFWEGQKERDQWEEQDVCGCIILGWILES